MPTTAVAAQGWYRDPFGRHDDRYFSAGTPTKLVRDGTVESYDPPPAGQPVPGALSPVVPVEPETARRGRGRRPAAPVDACRTVLDTLARCLGTD